jgi:hypothetical protein
VQQNEDGNPYEYGGLQPCMRGSTAAHLLAYPSLDRTWTPIPTDIFKLGWAKEAVGRIPANVCMAGWSELAQALWLFLE